MIDFVPKYNCKICTTAIDINNGQHIAETAFYRYFLNAKNEWVKSFLVINSFENVDFITRKFSVEINKELFHPSDLDLHLECVTYEKLSIVLNFVMSLNDKKVASGNFDIFPVDINLRKIISKSSLYEKVQFN